MLLLRRLVNSIVVESRGVLVLFALGKVRPSIIGFLLRVVVWLISLFNRLFSSPLGNFGTKIIFFCKSHPPSRVYRKLIDF